MAQDPTAAPVEPMIRFGDEWIPAHQAWSKIETATVVMEVINRFNDNFPDLSSGDTRDVVPLVRQRLKDISLRLPPKDAEFADLGEVCAGLLQEMSPEAVLEQLRREHNIGLDHAQLIQLTGESAYASALTREAREFAENRISPDQMAQLWNDAGRPAPGGGLWSAGKVEDLIAAP